MATIHAINNMLWHKKFNYSPCSVTRMSWVDLAKCYTSAGTTQEPAELNGWVKNTHKDKWHTSCLPQGLGPKEHMKMEQLTHLSRCTEPEVASHSQLLFVRCDKEKVLWETSVCHM